jgi:CRISPR-associated protein (TIGR03984 family)
MYKISNIKSDSLNDYNICFFDIKDKTADIFGENTAYIFLKESNDISIGLYKNKDFIFKDKVLENQNLFIDMRIFNKEKELYIWKTRDIFKSRLRVDGKGEKYDFYDEDLLLFGNKFKVDENFMRLKEERIKEYCIPINGNITNCNKKKLLIRNYMGMNEEDGTAVIKDFRLLDFRL